MKLLAIQGNQSLFGASHWSTEMDFAKLPFSHVRLWSYRSGLAGRSWTKSGVITEGLESRGRFNRGCELQNDVRSADSNKQRNQSNLCWDCVLSLHPELPALYQHFQLLVLSNKFILRHLFSHSVVLLSFSIQWHVPAETTLHHLASAKNTFERLSPASSASAFLMWNCPQSFLAMDIRHWPCVNGIQIEMFFPVSLYTATLAMEWIFPLNSFAIPFNKHTSIHQNKNLHIFLKIYLSLPQISVFLYFSGLFFGLLLVCFFFYIKFIEANCGSFVKMSARGKGEMCRI